MTEPWERIKMALAEAGRPEMADRIGPPDPGFDYSFPDPGFDYSFRMGWPESLGVADQKLLYRAAVLVARGPGVRLCFSCWQDRMASGEDDRSGCKHV